MALDELLNRLYIQKLPPELSIDNFLQGIGKYSYEDYLWEFVNLSDTFLEKSGGEKYTQPSKEDHGECDCQSQKYSLDFKLFSSQALFQSQSLFSRRFIYNGDDGVIIECAPKIKPKNPKYRKIQVTGIFDALREITLFDLMAIRNSNTKVQPADDIRHLLKIMEVKKNLLLFFPYNFCFEDVVLFKQGLDMILQAIDSAISDIMNYRNQFCPSKDVYLCFFYQQKLILTQWQNNILQLLETLPIEDSPLFMKILGLISDDLHWAGLK